MQASSSERLVHSLFVLLQKQQPEGCVESLQTHISWILLAGNDVYKIKKPVDLGFVDFTTLERRRQFCEEELRLNSRLAPQLYRDVVPITGTIDAPRLGGTGEAVEFAVRMHRFPDDALASQQLSAGNVEGRHIDDLAHTVAQFHDRTEVAAHDSSFGTFQQVTAPVLECLDQLRVDADHPLYDDIARIDAWVRAESCRLEEAFFQRRRAGFIRECHGDMHLGNMVLLDDRFVLFDCIEFNESFRWIDVMSDVAFCVMDLEDRGRRDFAFRFLNAYLAQTGDYEGVRVLRFYLVYRALVRGKVCRVRLNQPDLDSSDVPQIEEELRTYLQLALTNTRPARQALLITHGPSGTGKSTGTQMLLERLPAIRVRSDVERKRLFGASAAESKELPGAEEVGASDMYQPEWTARTYAALFAAAEHILSGGYPAILDATFLTQASRERARERAEELGVPLTILDFQADLETLKARIQGRALRGADPSDADVDVLKRQLQSSEPISAHEQNVTVAIDTKHPDAWERMMESLARLHASRGL